VVRPLICQWVSIDLQLKSALTLETFARQWFLSALEAVAAHGALPVAEVC